MRDHGAESAAAALRSLGIGVELVRERDDGRRTADLRCTFRGTQFLAEVKSRGNDQAFFQLVSGDPEQMHTKTVGVSPRLRLEEIAAQANDQLFQTDTGLGEFLLLYFLVQGVGRPGEGEIMERTLLGKRRVLLVHASHSSLADLYLPKLALFACAPQLTAAFIHDGSSFWMTPNYRADRLEEFRASDLYLEFKRIRGLRDATANPTLARGPFVAPDDLNEEEACAWVAHQAGATSALPFVEHATAAATVVPSQD